MLGNGPGAHILPDSPKGSAFSSPMVPSSERLTQQHREIPSRTHRKLQTDPICSICLVPVSQHPTVFCARNNVRTAFKRSPSTGKIPNLPRSETEPAISLSPSCAFWNIWKGATPCSQTTFNSKKEQRAAFYSLSSLKRSLRSLLSWDGFFFCLCVC